MQSGAVIQQPGPDDVPLIKRPLAMDDAKSSFPYRFRMRVLFCAARAAFVQVRRRKRATLPVAFGQTRSVAGGWWFHTGAVSGDSLSCKELFRKGNRIDQGSIHGSVVILPRIVVHFDGETGESRSHKEGAGEFRIWVLLIGSRFGSGKVRVLFECILHRNPVPVSQAPRYRRCSLSGPLRIRVWLRRSGIRKERMPGPMREM